MEPTTRERAAIPERFKFDLRRIYPDWTAWESDLARLESGIDRLAALQGSLSQGPAALVVAYALIDDLMVTMLKLHRYAQLTRDTDSRDNVIGARLQQSQGAGSRFQTAVSWFIPELLAIPWSEMEHWIETTPELRPRRFPISEAYRQQAHVLPEEQERLLSLGSRFNETPAAIYRELATTDVRFPTITLNDGSTRLLSYGAYASVMQTRRDQSDRARASEAFHGVFAGHRNTFAAIYNSILQRGWFRARARGYGSTFEAALDPNHVPVGVVDNLIKTVRAGVGPLRRYHTLRRKLLGLSEYHLYDTSIPVAETTKRFPFDEACADVIASVAPLGSRYQDEMRTLLAGGCLDVYENDGKRSGAYSAGVYGVGPFALLNYTNAMGDAFTLAHEMGHSMHTVLAYGAQPWATASYTIFVAEVASTLNEALFLQTLLAKTSEPRDRAALLQRQIDAITNTFYTQTLFADFERQAHQLVESGAPITADLLSEIYLRTLADYYGDAVQLDPLSGLTWTRISHFYDVPFYVYQYATSHAASAQIFAKISSGDPQERQASVARHLELLQSGGSAHPIEQLRRAGVDLSRPEPIEAVVRDLDRLLDEFERVTATLVSVPQHQ